MARRVGPKRSPFRVFFLVAVVYGLAFLAREGRRHWVSAVQLEAGKAGYYHYEFVDLRLRARDPALLRRWRAAPPRARVLRQGAPVATVGGSVEFPLLWEEERGAFVARWPCPWNAPPGEYVPALSDARGFEQRLAARPFRIETRKPRPIPRRFVALTFESVKPLATMRVRKPDGALGDWRGLLDWAQYVEADAFWMLAGRTPGEKPGELWVSHNLPLIPAVARECRRRGLKFGVWVMCYLTQSKTERLPRYQYALDVEDGKPVATRAISLDDPRRPADVAGFLKSLRDVPGVDYLGLDYIRNALGGYELADAFAAEMPGLRLPPEWPRLSREERMVWVARRKIGGQDAAFVDAWQWWRAHRTALLVRRIQEELGGEKPLWAFTLSWEKGWQHGQDPVMMNDAGVDADAVMLYEATDPQFEAMVQSWNGYLRRADAQLLVGDIVDWPLHQNSPRGPAELRHRLLRAAEGVYGDGPAAGLFVHDLARALWGRLGPWSTQDWLTEARDAARRFRSLP